VTAFQLDECLNDAHLAAACNTAAKCTAHRYPPRLKGKTDSEMLPVVFSLGRTLVTIDRTIIDDNPSSIVSPNPGIIVIKQKRPFPPITSKRAQGIIEKFKNFVPSWPQIDWSMVYAEIDEDEICVCSLINADTRGTRPFTITAETVDTELTRFIASLHAPVSLPNSS
jgi:hypothetical protein